MRLTEHDLVALEDEIRKVRDGAPIVRGTGGLRKIRFAPPSRHSGKSGVMRVGFASIVSKAAIIVVAIFAKNEAANFTPAERIEIAKLLRQIERDFK
jgi:hypothetical protein